MLQNAKDYLLEMFFPSHCVLCNKIGGLLCINCKNKLIFVKQQTCPVCNKVSEKGKVCASCKNKNSLTGVVSCLYFKDENVKDILHPYKYEGMFSLSKILSNMLIEAIDKEKIKFNLVAFVPAVKNRESKRGYNQSRILAEEIANHYNLPIIFALKKKSGIKTQVGLAKKDRLINLKNAFYIDEGISLLGRSVLIIDDVVTTGATLSECAKVLKGVGAREVWAATIAKE